MKGLHTAGFQFVRDVAVLKHPDWCRVLSHDTTCDTCVLCFSAWTKEEENMKIIRLDRDRYSIYHEQDLRQSKLHTTLSSTCITVYRTFVRPSKNRLRSSLTLHDSASGWSTLQAPDRIGTITVLKTLASQLDFQSLSSFAKSHLGLYTRDVISFLASLSRPQKFCFL